ncbi:hypothetical protein LAZ67_3002472 [Cordylochernes scorpioides]|uniref:Integrase catalytic domain-containing protein n=1 Tax=Cordylochernes scorpioides TaxID=51811 RepID=A0ABY6K998_9ARAC|nr:hypothetical protein LAZ67_3002472 [Cordylochernes scorpioides]
MEMAKMDLREWEFNLPVSNSKEEKGSPRRLTKRIVLSKIQQVFDPFRVYSPIFLPHKLLLQRSWELKIGWDSQLPEDMDREFRTWYSQIGLLNEIKIPRHIWFDQTNKNEIHVFCDASKSAYAAVAYMRSDVQAGVHLSLLWSKSRLAPTKRVTISRLELLTCVLGARLVKSISTALTNSCPLTLWTDSSTVMAWLKRKNEWNVFVRNRVQEIRDTVNNENWKTIRWFLDRRSKYSLNIRIVAWVLRFLDNARRIPTERGNLKVIELERAERKLLKLVQQETFPGKEAPKNGLKTIESFEALKRFICRRGRPGKIYSDNGTNFSKTNELLKRLDWGEIERESSVKRIQWIFIPPSAPWWGGFWERLVRVFKSLLVRMLGFSKLNYVQLETALCEVESIINNRALSYISEDDQDLSPLTPQMFRQTNANNEFPELEKIRVNSFTRKDKILSKLNEELKQRFRKEYLGVLIQRAENKRERCIKERDLVLIGQDNTKRIFWPVGEIIKLYLGKDEVNRVARVKTSTGEWLRPVQRRLPLEISSEETPENASEN